MLGTLRLLNQDRRFLTRLRAGMPPEDTRWLERVISGARLTFAVVAILAVYADPTEPPQYDNFISGLLITYLLLSLLGVWLAWFRAPGAKPAWTALHIADVSWFSIITAFSQGPSSPLYVFLLFILLVAAFQWGFLETLATASTVVAVLCAQVLLILLAPYMGRFGLEGSFELNRFILRSVFLLVMGLLLGYLAEQEKVNRAEANLIARLLSRVQAERGLRATLELVLVEALRIFGADRAVLVLREKRSARTYLWDIRMLPGSQHVALELSELDRDAAQPLLSFHQANVLHARMGSTASGVTALDESGLRVSVAAPVIPETIPGARAAKSLLLGSLDSAGEWRGPLILFDPKMSMHVELELRFLQRLLREVGPAAYSVYLVRRLRARVGAVERARVARELHDGAIQSLVALEMQMEVLRRPGAADPSRVSEKLADIQQLLHQEVLNLRELMEQIKPLEVGPHELLEHLAEKVEKFRSETGIAASFVCQIEEVTLPARAAREVSRIVQEALVNIRKHSAAHNVLVRLSANDTCWQLLIDDDGRGFDFSGRLSQAELDSARLGPVVIKERVRALGGELAVESRPGKGARLEISIPRRTHA
jgi:signal transduction histidine kinase